jgi:nucleoside-diphosphate-sugar epimerase
VIPEVIVRALRGEELRMTQGRQTREFNYVEDIVDGIVRAATVPGIEGELLNLGCGQDVSIREVTTLILDLLGNPVAAQFGALPDRPTEIWEMRSDSTKAREMLDWKPQHSLTDGRGQPARLSGGRAGLPGRAKTSFPSWPSLFRGRRHPHRGTSSDARATRRPAALRHRI